MSQGKLRRRLQTGRHLSMRREFKTLSGYHIEDWEFDLFSQDRGREPFRNIVIPGIQGRLVDFSVFLDGQHSCKVGQNFVKRIGFNLKYRRLDAKKRRFTQTMK